ncbi:MAG: hypothetical protein ACRCW9_06160 [Cetobacterium sp.]
MDLGVFLLYVGLVFNYLMSNEYKKSIWESRKKSIYVFYSSIISIELYIYIKYFEHTISKIVLIQLLLTVMFNLWINKKLNQVSRKKFLEPYTSKDFEYKITNKFKNKEKIKEGIKMIKKIIGITSFILLTQLSYTKELNPYDKLQNFENSIHYGKNQNNVFIQYEQWQNLKRDIELQNEYRYYFTEKQKEEFRERNQLRYEKEVLNHFINMNRLEELNQRPNIYYYEQNNNYYRRRYYK